MRTERTGRTGEATTVQTVERATRFTVTPSTDPRDRLRAGEARDLPQAARFVEAGCVREQAEIVANYRRDGVTAPKGMSETMTATVNAAREAAWHYEQEHAEFVKRLSTRLTDAGLFDWAEALERGSYSRLGW
jgi:hypothetical protein